MAASTATDVTRMEAPPASFERHSMAKTSFATVDEYISTFPAAVRDVLEEVRGVVHSNVPDAEEVISYQIPAFKYHGFVLYVSAHKNHFSISCPPPFTIFEVFKDELARYEVSKSAIRFPLAEPVPVDLIGRIARFRAEENRQRDKATPARNR